ncbi:uncharacterized protein TM35_000801060 [Trypanosoma theileri]|uniref:Uncharacterized protein n=1 Tax=Trypanosoma theileri TaxID=67003 RepID=A0A1X0NGF4_9TRYP|nr:uncharacterized protein TM35_000801060 [Trypanosoma theileri]ORC82968.1 hypothetical protein TM35_000801060 [Trypanosoma theileri]
MFVQLHRVVYLLVLLQCCVCVAYGNTEAGVGGHGTSGSGGDVLGEEMNVLALTPKPVNVNYTDAEINGDQEIDTDLKLVVKQTLLRLRDSQIPFANATACKSIWERAIEANNETVKKSKDAVEKIKNFGERIDNFTEKKNKGENKLKLKDGVEAEGFKKLVDEINAELKKSKSEIPDAKKMETIDGAVYTKHVCLTVRGNAKNALDNLKRSLEDYETFKKETAKSTKAKEVKEAGENRRDALEKVLAQLRLVELDAERSVSKAKDQVKDWADALGRFFRLGEMVTALASTDDARAESAIKTANNETVEEIKKVATEQKVKDIRKLVNEVDDATKTRRVTIVEKIKKEVESANVKAAARVEEEVREAIKAKEIADEEERARKAREEEEARRDAEEKAKQKAEEEKARKAEEEEEARRVAEEKAKQKAEEEKARKAKEEEAKQAAEVAKEKVKEEAKKKKDGSSSPALMHSPLLLLLLSVLGCTLVC